MDDQWIVVKPHSCDVSALQGSSVGAFAQCQTCRKWWYCYEQERDVRKMFLWREAKWRSHFRRRKLLREHNRKVAAEQARVAAEQAQRVVDEYVPDGEAAPPLQSVS